MFAWQIVAARPVAVGIPVAAGVLYPNRLRRFRAQPLVGDTAGATTPGL